MSDASVTSAVPAVPLADRADLSKAPIGIGADDAASLLGSRCGACGATYFPRRLICFECRSTSLQDNLLSRRGVLYAWTTVHVSSSRPSPYTIGYVDLPEGVRILTTLLDTRERLHFDQVVELRVGADNEWAFEPLTDAQWVT